jgi:nickel-dependent lactate racemase
MGNQCHPLADNKIVEIKYGKHVLSIKLPYHCEILELEYSKLPLKKSEIIDKIFSSSTDMPSLLELIDKSKKILFLIPDITRKSGVKHFLYELIEYINNKAVDYKIVFATGTHRRITEGEMKEILGFTIYDNFKEHIVFHNPDNLDDHIYYGKTKYGTPVLLNKVFNECDLIISIASISYHYFAGFGGGRKMIIPGISATKTALNNHKLAIDEKKLTRNPEAKTANIKGNPVHDDIVEGVMIVSNNKELFAINTIIDEEENIIDLETGDLFLSHLRACTKYREMTSINVTKKYDILVVSCGGFPKDINMIQAHKSLNRIQNIVKEGGTIFFFAECIDGYGNKHFENFFECKTSGAMIRELIKDYQINKQTAYSLKSLTEKFNVYLYSALNKSDTERMGFKKLESLEVIEHYKFNNKSIAFVPSAYSVLFTE